MLLHRYGNIEYILNLPIDFALDLIIKAKEKEKEERMFIQWVVQLPNMDKENYTSFKEYKDRLTGANIDRRTDAEIMADADAAEKELKGA